MAWRNLNPFPHIVAFWRLCEQTAFWKHSDKRRNCTKRAISPFATMFSTFSHRTSIQLKRFSMFWQNMFKVVCCSIVVWGIGLKPSLLQTIFENCRFIVCGKVLKTYPVSPRICRFRFSSLSLSASTVSWTFLDFSDDTVSDSRWSETRNISTKYKIRRSKRVFSQQYLSCD